MPHSSRRRSPFLLLNWLLIVLCAAVGPVYAGDPVRVPVNFSITQDVGSGNEVFVTGSHRDLSSGGIQPFGVKLHWTAGNIWTGSIAIEAGARINYSYISRAISTTSFCGSSGSNVIGGPNSLTVPNAPGPPYTGKLIRYVSTWSSANLLFRDNTQGTDWATMPMRKVGQGRTPTENAFEVSPVAAPAHEIEFVFFNDNNQFDNAPAPPQNPAQPPAPAVPVPYQNLAPPYNYRTSLDVFAVQDGQVFNYQPPATVSPPNITTRFVNSTVSGIPGRNIKIFVPRGYAENTSKRYPVVYFHDGQNVFFPGGTFGTWDADRVGTYEMSQGRMREAILVAIDNGDDYGSNRQIEYIPPGDQLSGRPPGTADKYVQFLRDNVLPTLDYNYRTLNQPDQPSQPEANITIGSSLGGLLTAYLGTTNSSVFGQIGVVSPAFWAGPNFRTNTLNPSSKLPLTIYMDIGSNESSAGQAASDPYWLDAHAVYNGWLDKGYIVNSDLLLYPKCNGANNEGVHNEAAWSRRLPTFYQFVLSLWSEPNPLAVQKFPPKLELMNVDSINGNAQLRFLAPLGIPFTLSRSSHLQSWPDSSSVTAASAIWEEKVLTEMFSTPPNQRFWRITAP